MRMFLKSTSVPIVLTIWLICSCADETAPDFAGSGVIEATEITVSSKVRGEVVAMACRKGDTVQREQTLAKIDTKDFDLQKKVFEADLDGLDWNEKIIWKDMVNAEEAVKQASIALSNIKKNRDRIANLLEEKAATQEQFDKLETEYELAASRLNSAKNQLEKLKISLESLVAKRGKIEANISLLEQKILDGTVHAPADGVIIEKYVEQGELVNFGTPLYTIADLSSVWLTIYVGEDKLGRIALGDEARIRVDSHPDREFRGVVAWISQEAEFTPKNVQTKDSRVDLVYAVKITIDNSEGIFKIGMPADAYIEGI